MQCASRCAESGGPSRGMQQEMPGPFELQCDVAHQPQVPDMRIKIHNSCAAISAAGGCWVQTDVDAESGCDLENKAGAPVDGSAAKACCKDGAPRCACGTPAPVSTVECLALEDSLTLACVLKNAAHGQAAWHGDKCSMTHMHCCRRCVQPFLVVAVNFAHTDGLRTMLAANGRWAT